MSKGSYKEVILRRKVEELGNQGDIVRVKAGYARNYLIPQGLAMVATPGNLQMMEEQQQQAGIRQRKIIEEAGRISKNLKKLSLTAPVQVGEEDRIFGSVTAMTISNLLKEQGYEIEKRDIVLDEPIKALGLYSVPVKLRGDLQVNIKVYVIKE